MGAAYGEQLRLRALPVDEARWLLVGGRPSTPGVRLHPQYPAAETLGALAMLLQAHAVMTPGPLGEPPVWWVHQIVVDDPPAGDTVVGDIGFHGPPGPDRPRTVEIGYHVVPAWRGRGLATRACRLLLDLAWAAGADKVVAETDAGNGASQRVLLANGFRRGLDATFSVERP